MKKLIFIFLILFMSVLNINAEESFYLGEKVPNMYVESIKDNNIHNGAPFLLHRSDGSIVYCINPFLMMSTTGNYKEYNYNDSIFNLTDEELNRLNIISYYGYGYEGHSDIKWFGITQYYMWKSLDFDDVYFTDVYYGTKIENYVDEVNELDYLVNNYYKMPSFSGNHYEYSPNETYELTDTNNVLNNYQIKASDISANINENKLIINTNGDGIYNISFVRKSPISRDYILYNLEGSQSLIYPGKINDITFNISIEVNSGSISINKCDCENLNRLEAKLDGSLFGLYKDNNLISKLTIKDNKASINNLSLGNYVLKELTSSEGYKKDDNIYNIIIDKENKEINIDSCSEIIYGNLIINKYYGDKDNYKLDESAVFEVYHNNKLIKTINNNDNIKLEYGTYLVKQVNGKKYYDLINEFNLSILEEKDYIYDFYTGKTDEIKAYEEMLNKREESLNQKEENLNNLENKINEERNNLDSLKEEINKKEEELDNKKENLIELEKELEKKKESLDIEEEELKELENKIKEKQEQIEENEKKLEELNKKLEEKENDLKELEQNIIEKNESLDKYKEELNQKENELISEKENLEKDKNKIKEKQEQIEENEKKLEELNKKLEEKENDLKEIEQNIIEKNENLDKYKEELDDLEKELNQKENELTSEKENLEKDKNKIKEKQEQIEENEKKLEELNKKLEEKENDLVKKEEQLNKKEQDIIKLENKNDEVLVVEVPNTYKKNYNKLISLILIITGIILIVYNKKKVTG